MGIGIAHAVAISGWDALVVEPDEAQREKAGARFEGIARCRLRHRGLPQSAAIYALTAADLATPA